MWPSQTHPTQPRGGHPSHSNLVRGKLTSPTPNPAGDGTSGLTSYPRRRSKVSEATCLRPQRSAPSRTRTWAVRPRVQRSDHWATHASPIILSPEELNKIKSMLQQLVTEISDKYIDLTIFCFKNKISFIQNIAIKVQF